MPSRGDFPSPGEDCGGALLCIQKMVRLECLSSLALKAKRKRQQGRSQRVMSTSFFFPRKAKGGKKKNASNSPNTVSENVCPAPLKKMSLFFLPIYVFHRKIRRTSFGSINHTPSLEGVLAKQKKNKHEKEK